MQMAFSFNGESAVVTNEHNPKVWVSNHTNETNIFLWTVLSEEQVDLMHARYPLIMAQLIQKDISFLKSTGYYYDYINRQSVDDFVQQFKFMSADLGALYKAINDIPYYDSSKDLSYYGKDSLGLLTKTVAVFNSARRFLEKLTELPLPVINALIKDERKVQYDMWGYQLHSPAIWSVILTEEVGEVAQALQKSFFHAKDSDAQDIVHELIQVTAILHAMIEELGDDYIWTSTNR